jgi:hypothetical protein
MDLPDAIARRAKMEAVARGVSLKDLVVAALERELEGRRERPAKALRLPLVPSRKPGARRLSPEDIHAILAREERATYEAPRRR